MVTLATLSAVAITVRQQLDIHRTANVLNGEQAYLYGLGGESWAKRILLQDRQDSTTDHYHEAWAQPLPALPLPGGTIRAQLEDLQSRFNLNNLAINGQVNQESLLILERLLLILDLSPTIAQEIVDWIDSDLDPYRPTGAEDNIYLMRKPAYRTSNTYLRDPSEIRLLASVDKESYQKLLPYISTLPTHTPINVNTAPPTLLRAIVAGLTEVDATTLVTTRHEKPFNSIQDFIVQEALAGLTLALNNLAVASDYFLFTAHVQINQRRSQLSSLLYRQPQTLTVIRRSQGNR